MLEEIGKIATDVAKRKGATLLLDKAGPSLIGIPAVIYADAPSTSPTR
jgi:outer membrane protein